VSYVEKNTERHLDFEKWYKKIEENNEVIISKFNIEKGNM